ncbi:MAG: hypothetical protein GY842_04545 [bacterium]|nr:hypothetical protein [bacterium]
MIEFKGECGHTIRVRDEDAGKVVRCSYCGQEARVPDEREDQLDFLLNEVERTGEFESPRRARPKKAGGGRAPTEVRSRSDFNPFAVALKMCYAAIIISVLIIAFKYGAKQLPAMFSSGGSGGSTASEDSNDNESDGASAQTQGKQKRTRYGRLRPELPPDRSGIFADSVPRGAEVYYRKVGERSDSSIFAACANPKRAGQMISNARAGEYEVAVALELYNEDLMGLPGYSQEVLDLLDDPDLAEKEIGEVLKGYFIPDRAVRVSIERLGRIRYVVRWYSVEVLQADWAEETALFLPRAANLSELLEHLPERKTFNFDVEHQRQMLTQCRVPEEDQPMVVQALEWIGMIPYLVKRGPGSTRGGRYRLFFLSQDGKMDWEWLPE